MNAIQKHLFTIAKRVEVLALACMLWAAPQAAMAADVTVNVVMPDGTTPITGAYRWLVEEDRTFDVIPDVTGTASSGNVTNTLSLNFHRSYMPVVASGDSAGGPTTITNLDATKRYFVSVLPNAVVGSPGQGMAGAQVRSVNGSTFPAVNIVSHPLPIRTAQISVFVFNDNNPINNQPDAPGQQELGLCGFDVHLYDAGGTYGASGGRISVDVFGNPLGSTYSDDQGTLAQRGSGLFRTGKSGVVRIRNLAPAKYTIYTYAPSIKPTQDECPMYYGQSADTFVAGTPLVAWPSALASDNSGASNQWMQTTTIEGTPGQDAWVKSNEPGYFREFGPPGHHVFIGFVARTNAPGNPNSVINPDANGTSVSGRVVNIHSSRPPAVTFFNGKPVNLCRVGISESSAGTGGGRGVWAADCNPDGTFNVTGLKRGQRYQLAVWDKPLDNVFATYEFFTPVDGSPVALNEVPVFSWFSRLEGYVFHDKGNAAGVGAQDGFRQGISYTTLANGETREVSSIEPGIEGQAVNIRFRDGSIYQSVATDAYGYYEFPEFFPFFNWMVAEVDYLRYKATGATIITDNGGQVPVDNGWNMPSRNKVNPQPQFDETGAILRNTSVGAGNNNLSRTEVGPVLLEGMQDFLGQTNIIHWGKTPYTGTESGGISGIVHYASTRAEWDPIYAAAENNEPGIPGVTVKLYRADPTDYTKPIGMPIRIVQTDSWDDALPTNCQGAKYVFQGATLDCYDGLRNFNQVRPAVFDGGYAFWDHYPQGQEYTGTATNALTPGLPQGYYIVEVVTPPGYEVQKEEDKNVDFGEVYQISTLNEAVGCVGTRPYPVPQFLTLFPDVEIPAEYRTGNRPLCDKKAVEHFAKQNTAVDFHLFTTVPVSGHIVGMILDDLANEFDPNAPAFGEKYAPPFMPISLRDFSGREFSRVYSDIYGTYNALVPSSFTFNVPIPSGVSPNMVTACLNSPTKKDGNGGYTLDPHFNRQYSQFCYTFQYLPGKTTYLDTPVLPISAFAGPQQYALDCDNQDKVPGIHSVSNSSGQGPWVTTAGETITIKSMGVQDVPNPLYDQEARTGNKLIQRDYGFGAAQGQVTLNGVSLNITSWSDAQIVATVDTTTTGVISAGQLMVKRSDNGQTSMRGVHLHIGGTAPTVVNAGGSIQAAVDAAADGGLITVAPGLYEEAVILHKRVRLQGFGAGGTYINPLKEPAEKLAAWRDKACDLAFANPAALLPGQALTTLADCKAGNPADNAPLLFGMEESAGILVFTSVPGLNSDAMTWTVAEVQAMPKVQIDGFTITGADHGGGIVVNGKAPGIEIANNRVTGNLAPAGGGIRIGHFELTANDLYVASRTQYANIHNNEVNQNGNGAGEIGGGGGGVSIYTGTHDYRVANNMICGNFSTGNGGGMAHVGISNNGVIEGNTFLHNQSFFQMKSVQGGGLSIEGLQSLAATGNLAGISTGSGNVKIIGNTFQGNAAGAGDGGAISLNGINGNEVLTVSPYQVEIYNNTINNNVAGVAGGGIGLQDAVNVKIINNTIAHNDSTGTGYKAFNGGAPFRLLPPGTPGTNIPATTTQNAPGLNLSQSTAQPGAGVASRVNTPALDAALLSVGSSLPPFSSPTLANNIVWQNRTFYWSINNTIDPVNCQLSGVTGSRPCFGLVPVLSTTNASPVYSDFGVIGGTVTQTLSPRNSVLTSVAGFGGANNTAGNPQILSSYFNGARNRVVDSLILTPESQTQNLQTAAAFDEGGNFIDVRFGPLTPINPATGAKYSNPHVPTSSSATARGSIFAAPELQRDAAGVLRSSTGPWTAGAFEAQ